MVRFRFNRFVDTSIPDFMTIRLGLFLFAEADLLVEIIDPGTGQPVPDGTPGEIVITTLTRKGMPLIRFRSGDMSAFMVDPCRCGTVLKTLDTVRGRVDGSRRWNNRIRSAVLALPAIRTAVADGRLTVAIRTSDRRMAVTTCTGKRRIRDLRKQEGDP